MSAPHNEVERAALDWLVRVNDPHFDAWTEWETWLSRDPRHEEVYWALAEREADLVAALASTEPAARPTARVRGGVRPRQWAAAAGLAAAVILGLAIWPQMGGRQLVTAPGAPQSFRLADGSWLHLDGDSRVTVRGSRRARLDEGRLLAEVVHDDHRPFVLTVDDATLTDLGTAFDVTRLQDGVRVAVTEGLVEVRVSAQTHTLGPGEGLVARGETVETRALPPADAEAWRTGRLVYRDERLSIVAEDLSRSLGRPVTVAPGLEGRRFSGSIGMGGAPERLRPRLELLLDVDIAEDGDGWRLAPRQAR